MQEIIPIIVTALISPLFLKIVEYVLNKNSEQTKAWNTKIDSLSARVDELREKNLQQQIEIGVLKAQLREKDQQISELKSEVERLQAQKQDATN
ncbi:MAG: hypothetical protein HY867_06135 [Chloroflexi bacterium]|nr:hypothetical protein [Chloroflexota bacterium]